jgi:hypothetical protein
MNRLIRALSEYLNCLKSRILHHRPQHGKPVPSYDVILRIPNGPLPKDFTEHPKPEPSWFVLSSSDETQIPPRLSVFVNRLTTIEQAWVIAGAKDDRRAAAVLRVKEVRNIAPSSDADVSTPLPDVIWDREGMDDPSVQGNLGHSGITGLACRSRVVRKYYRMQLADISEIGYPNRQ